MKRMMAFNHYKSYFLYILILTLNLSPLVGEGLSKAKILSALISFKLETFHFAHKDLDDSTSEAAFEEFLSQLDHPKTIFLKKDIEELSIHKKGIDDMMRKGDFPLLQDARAIFYFRLGEVIKFVEKLEVDDLRWDDGDLYETDLDKVDYCVDFTAQKKRWLNFFKYKCLRKAVYKSRKKDGKKDPLKESKKYFVEIKKQHFELLKEIARRELIDDTEIFINSISRVYDPHSVYMKPTTRRTFKANMEGQYVGIGVRIENCDEGCKITYIQPGGAADQTKQLKIGDKIIGIGGNVHDITIISGMGYSSISKKLHGKKGAQISLLIKREDKEPFTVEMKRKVMKIFNNHTRALLIKKDSGFKTALVYVPVYFSNKPLDEKKEKDVETNSVSGEVTTLLKQLKKEKIDSLILDLRNNGGGHIKEACRLTGLFIDEGPVVQVKDVINRMRTLKDEEKGALYDGPMAVLINGNSASASEITASTLQDYKRAVIIGSQSHGKGTVQVLMNLDDEIKANKKTEKFLPLGALKLTQSMFYRVNGSSTQLKGVEPDIELLHLGKYSKNRESDLDHPLPWGSVKEVSFKKSKNKLPSFSYLTKRSRLRTKKSKVYKAIEETLKVIKFEDDNTQYTLKADKFWERRNKLLDAYDNKALDDIEPLTIMSYNIPSRTHSLKEGFTSSDNIKGWAKGMASDPWVQESVNILEDMAGLIR